MYCKHIWRPFNVFNKTWKGDIGDYVSDSLSGNPYVLKCTKCGINYYLTIEYKRKEQTYLEVQVPKKIERKLLSMTKKEVKKYENLYNHIKRQRN